MNKRKRLNFLQVEKKKNIWKYLNSSFYLPVEIKYSSFFIFIKHFNSKNSLTKIRKICKITGRSRGIAPKFGISRHIFKKLVRNGDLNF